MPKMPTKESLSAPGSFRSGRELVTAGDVDFSAVGRGIEAGGKALSKGVESLKSTIDKDQREQDALDLIKAEAAQRQALFDTERQFDDDGDYATHDQRYTPLAQGATDQAAGIIRNPEMREKWRLKAQADVLAGRERLIRRADGYAKQDAVVDLENALEQYKNEFVNPDATPEMRQQALKRIDDTIEVAQRGGIVPPKAAQQLREGYVKGSVLAEAERRLLDDPEGLRRELLGKDAPLPEEPAANADPNQPRSVKTVMIDPATGEPVKRAEGVQTKAGVRQISTKLETGKDDPLEGVSNISPDSAGSKSYGNFGLNTGGSIKDFAKEYGGMFGLTAKPGTAAFDQQWKNAAAAAPVELHAAEMEWWDKNIVRKQMGMLVEAGVDPAVAADPRVASYFADRSVQYGPASIKNHAERVAAAAGKAGEDPVAFIKAMSKIDGERIEDDFPTAIRTVPKGEAQRDRYIGGLENRVSRREAAALGVVEPEDTGRAKAGRYGALSPLERAQLLDKSERAMRTQLEGRREQLKQSLDDDVESIRQTGQGSVVDLETAKRVLESNQVNRYFLNRQEAQMEYAAVNDLPSLSNAELTRRLDQVAPKPGEPLFEMKFKVFEKAEKEATRLRELRDTDPAKSVEMLPEVKEAATAVNENPEDPVAIQTLARARIDAQRKVGVPESQRSPITKAEARIIMAPIKGLEGKALTESMIEVVGQLEAQYGPYARAAGVAAVDQVVNNKELAEEVEKKLKAAFQGLPPSAATQRRIEYFTESAQAQNAFGGAAVGDPMEQYGLRAGDREAFGAPPVDPMQNFTGPRPGKKAIDALLGNPALAVDFDKKYGPGSASMILSQPIENFMPQDEKRK